MAIQRILVANRGEIARRIIRTCRASGIESVAVFSEPDVEQPFVEEADFSTYLNGATVEDTYLNAERVLAAAMDAGCDAVHPGYCFLAERVDFAQMAMMANLAVVGADPRALARSLDRDLLRDAASKHGIPLMPSSRPLASEDDGLEAAASLGVPLLVKTPAGGPSRRVERLEDVPMVVERVRADAKRWNGDSTVFLERAIDRFRRCGTIVALDHEGNGVHLGTTDATLALDGRSWVEELGPGILPAELDERVGAAAVALARELGWVGVGRVRWAVTPHGGWYLLGFSGRLTTGYTLCEQVLDIDLVQLQLALTQQELLPFAQHDVRFQRHAIQLRVFTFQPSSPTVPAEGAIDALELPAAPDLLVEAGTAEGQPCTADTDPLLVKITVTAPTRSAALVRSRAVLEEVRIDGVSTNREALLDVLADTSVWKGETDVQTLPARLGIDARPLTTDA